MIGRRRRRDRSDWPGAPLSADPADQEPGSLTETTVRGIGVAGMGYAASQLLNFIAYLVLVRLLTPRAFGLYAAGTLITGIGGLFAESGMLAALIKRQDRLEESASTAFVSLAVTGVLLSLASLALSPLLGLAFHSSEVGTVTAVLSGWLLIRALTIVPDALLQRRFSFARRVVVDPLGVLAYAAASIPLAASGAGVWAMVAGAYASIIVQLIAAWVAADFRPRAELASLSLWRELASFARPLVLGEIARRLTSQVDTFMLGRFSGAAALGQYRNGMMLAQQPGGIFGQVAAYVILPVFARIADIPDRIAAAARHAFWVTSVVIIPISLACLPLGVPVAVIVLGEKWRPAGHAIAGLSGLVLGGTLLSISGELMKAIGALRLQVMVQGLWLALVTVTVVGSALIWGLLGVAIAMSASTCIAAAYAMVRIAGTLAQPSRQFFSGMAKPAAASVAMIVAMLLFAAQVRLLDHSEVLRTLLLVTEVLIGTLVYGGLLAAIDAPRRRGGMAILRRVRSRVKARAGGSRNAG